MRDAKVNSIYEGPNGIQAMDLLGRKIGMRKGEVFATLINRIKDTISDAKDAGLKDLADKLEDALNRLQEVAGHLTKQMRSSDIKLAFSFASPFLEVMGDVLVGWMLLWRASVAKPALDKIIKDSQSEEYLEMIKKNKNAAFYEGQLKSAQYFIEAIQNDAT